MGFRDSSEALFCPEISEKGCEWCQNSAENF